MNDLREHLMQTLAALRDRDRPMEVDRARAVAQVAAVAVETAKVEVEYIRATGGNSRSPFLTPVGTPEIPAPDNAGSNEVKQIGNGTRSSTQPTATGIIHPRPVTMPSFEVFPINNSSKRIGPSVVVRADDIKRAEVAGKYWMRVLGRTVRHVRAVPYRPELDPAVRMFIRRNSCPLQDAVKS